MIDTAPEQPPPARPRTTMRDLIGSIVVLLLIIGAFVWVTRACTFSPGGPTVDQATAPTVDAARALEIAAASVDFPIRRPTVPPGWHANSSSTSAVGRGTNASVIVRVGWLTPGGRFIQLSQSAGAPADVLAAETDRPDSRPTGQVDVAGTTWTAYPGRREEQAWLTTLGNVTLLVTGSAPESDFRTLAEALQSATPIPR